jgi:hypothetical protein
MNTRIKKMTFKRMMFVAVLLLSLVIAPSSYAALTAVGPPNAPIPPGDGFPLWYQDSTGLTLGQCLDLSGNCIVLPDDFYDGVNPIVFPLNYPGESFYWIADTLFGPFRYRAALEAAFATANPIGAPVNGQQSIFARVRIRGHVPVVGTYTFTHPYGTDTFVVNALTPAGAPEINATIDVPLGIPLDFAGALAGPIGPFLRPSATPGGAPLPFVVDPATGARYIANAAQFVAVTGSPFGTNFVSVVGPASNDSTTLFNLAGKVVGMVASPAAITFAAQMPAVTTAATFTITNPDLTASATLGAGVITGANVADFTLGPDTCSGAVIPASGICAVTVNFSEAAPGVFGAKSAVVSFPVTTPLNRPSLVVNLAGSIDNIAPTVVTTLPTDGDQSWPLNNRPHVIFSEPVTGVSAATFIIKDAGGVDVGGTPTLAGGTIADYALPAGNLQVGVTYTATLTTGITDLVGNPLAATSFSFKTTVADTVAPTVKSTTPVKDALGVRVTDPIIATFAGTVDPGDVNATTFFLSDGATGAVTFDTLSGTATLKPDKPLEFFHKYTATLKGGASGITSLGQVPMAADFTWSFLTNGAPAAPTLYQPADGTTGVAVPVDLKWIKTTDEDGEPVSYHLWYCTNPAMLGCTPVDVTGSTTTASSSLRDTLAGLGGYGAAMLLAGIAVAGGVRSRRKIFFFIAVLAISGMAVTACSKKTETVTVPAAPVGVDQSTVMTQSVSNLKSGTTYWWKVVADDDNGALVESATWKFTTQ